MSGEDTTAMVKRLVSEGSTDDEIMTALCRRFPRSQLAMGYIQRIRASQFGKVTPGKVAND